MSAALTLEQRTAGLSWYHTIDLPGEVATPGHYDTRPTVGKLPMPKSLAGMRCLDVGTSDGFWAFEMERRGAAEVVALDIADPARYDWPEPRPERPSRPANQEAGLNPNFELAHMALASRVERVDLSVYEISPEALGEFDFVFMGALLLHLRDPVLAFSAIRSVVRGQFLSAEIVSAWATLTSPLTPAAALCGHGQPRWWTPNVAAHRRMLTAAGWALERCGGPYFMPFGRGFEEPMRLRDLTPARVRAADIRRLTFEATLRRSGVPCMWAVCRSRST